MTQKTLITKTLDSKGRVTLGAQYAGQTVTIDDSDPRRIVIQPVVMIPAAEAWIYKNETALGRLREGLEQAQSGEFSDERPHIEGDMEWLEDVED